MLNFTMKGSFQDILGFNWDFYGDDDNPSAFYIVPRPQFVLDEKGNPSFLITRYSTDDASDGFGFWRFDVELSVPLSVETVIRLQIAKEFPHAKAPYFFIPLNYNPDGAVYLNFQSGGDNITFCAPVSGFGSNVASFLLQMTKEQLDTVEAAFKKGGGGFEIEYHLSVPARLPAVTAKMSFDSSIAYQYQVTHPRYNRWGHQTSPGFVNSFLQESAASKTDIKWGIANPPPDLRKAVTSWANATMADLVKAEVEKVISIQGLQSGESFNINEVSSFTSTYIENMVVKWIISPSAALPSFASRGLDISNFISTVNERKQQMTVSAFLPFKADSADSEKVPAVTLPDGKTFEALVDHVAVTVQYPGLAEANAGHVFKENGSLTFTAPYTTPEWDLLYTVTYSDPSIAPVSGRLTGIEESEYTLQVEEAGVLTVMFDAQQAFATEAIKPQEIEIAFSYVDRNGGTPIQQLIQIKSSDPDQRKSISSYNAMPLNSKYNYRATYIFAGGVRYEGTLVQDQTGFLQIIPAADSVHSCNLTVFVANTQADTNPIFGATVEMWYEQPPALPPGAPTQPTKDSPAVFNITPNPDQKGNLFGRELFVGLLSGDRPLAYSASIDAPQGQIDISETRVSNTQPSIMVTPTQRYFTIEISPDAIDWSEAAFKSVQVLVRTRITQGSAPSPPPDQPSDRAFTWNTGETGSKYATYSIQDGNEVRYDWEASYIIPGQTVQTATGREALEPILNIPASPAPLTAAGAGRQ